MFQKSLRPILSANAATECWTWCTGAVFYVDSTYYVTWWAQSYCELCPFHCWRWVTMQFRCLRYLRGSREIILQICWRWSRGWFDLLRCLWSSSDCERRPFQCWVWVPWSCAKLCATYYEAHCSWTQHWKGPPARSRTYKVCQSNSNSISSK